MGSRQSQDFIPQPGGPPGPNNYPISNGPPIRPPNGAPYHPAGQSAAMGPRQPQGNQNQPGAPPSFTVGQIMPSPRNDSIRAPYPQLPNGAAPPMIHPSFQDMDRPPPPRQASMPNGQASIPPRQASVPPRSDSMRSIQQPNGLPHPPSLPDFRNQPSPGNGMRPPMQSPGFEGPGGRRDPAFLGSSVQMERSVSGPMTPGLRESSFSPSNGGGHTLHSSRSYMTPSMHEVRAFPSKVLF